MTDSNNTQSHLNIQIGTLSYEIIIAAQSVSAGIEAISRRPDIPEAMREPLVILQNLSGRAVEASILLQDTLWSVLGISGISDAANDAGALDPHDPNDFSPDDGNE